MDEMMRCCLEFELMGVHEAMHVVGGPGYSHGKKGTPIFACFQYFHPYSQRSAAMRPLATSTVATCLKCRGSEVCH